MTKEERRAKLEEAEHRDQVYVLRCIRDDPNSTNAEKLEAVKLLLQVRGW